jgi:hypothetical protein
MFLVCFLDLKFALSLIQQSGELQIQHTRRGRRERNQTGACALKARPPPGDLMDELDFTKAPLEDLRRLALSRSAFSAEAVREMTRRAYDLPADAPPPRARETLGEA